CDVLALDGTIRPSERASKVYAYATRMRSALIYTYGRSQSRGHKQWLRTKTGQWTGNPALSHPLARYIAALPRR
ncbi:hypothetical protein K466DRAFT_503048, partial [Polyporus arcularius HHB13444]